MNITRQNQQRNRFGLVGRFMVFIGALVVIVTTALTVVSINSQQEIVRNRVFERSTALTSLLKSTAYEELILRDIASLRENLAHVLAQDEVLELACAEGAPGSEQVGRFQKAGLPLPVATGQQRQPSRQLEIELFEITQTLGAKSIQMQRDIPLLTQTSLPCACCCVRGGKQLFELKAECPLSS